jgi:hypothetical protein
MSLMTKSEKEFEVKLPVTGGCVCGSVRYEITAQPLFQTNEGRVALPFYRESGEW